MSNETITIPVEEFAHLRNCELILQSYALAGVGGAEYDELRDNAVKFYEELKNNEVGE